MPSLIPSRPSFFRLQEEKAVSEKIWDGWVRGLYMPAPPQLTDCIYEIYSPALSILQC